MAWGDPIPGSEEMPTYPGRTGFWEQYKGIQHFGSIKWHGMSVYKFAPDNIEQVKSLGWKHVHTTSMYAYFQKPDAN